MLAALHLLLLPVWLAAPSPGAPTSVAIHDERLLLGTERGLYQNGTDGWALILTRGGVLDLASANGNLLIATGAGLYHWRSGADRPAKILLGAGARIRAVASDRLDTEWVAAESGLYTRVRGAASFRRERSLPTGIVASVRTSPAGVWVAMQGAIWRRGRGQVFERLLRGLEAGWWELRGAVDVGEDSLLCVPRGLWRIDAAGGAAAGAWGWRAARHRSRRLHTLGGLGARRLPDRAVRAGTRGPAAGRSCRRCRPRALG